jgi:hypothetical protein
VIGSIIYKAFLGELLEGVGNRGRGHFQGLRQGGGGNGALRLLEPEDVLKIIAVLIE